MNKYHKYREDIYNDVIQEYSELVYHGERWYTKGKQGDNIQNIISNIVDLVEMYGDDVYKVINLNDYSLEHLMDYEYLETQMIDWVNDYK
jgi:hypothetical protein|tara:strand:+ start:118 stop:387 length:270 start_codon:yes stop_codon:yes gene_type:complete